MPSPLRHALLSFASALAAPVLAEEPPQVERVEIAGTHQMPAGSYLFYVSTKPGDRYDEVRLRGDFRRLWDTGFLDDLRLEVLVGPEAIVPPAADPAQRARENLVHVLFNHNDFVTVR